MKEKELRIQNNHYSNKSNNNIIDLQKTTIVNESIEHWKEYYDDILEVREDGKLHLINE